MSNSILEWHDREWTNRDGSPKSLEQVALKLAEEVGEVSGAIIKHNEQRKGMTTDEIKKELGDVLIVVEVIAARLGWETRDVLGERWASVRKRKSADYR